MSHRYLFLAALLLPALPALAQQPWQPFRVGLSYQYSEAATPGDTTHVLRLGAGVPVAGSATDSVFRFTSRVIAQPVKGGCKLELSQPDNLFGATLRSAPGGVFTLAAANGRSLTLRPRLAVGKSCATGLPGLTAQVATREANAAVLGAATDSVVTIQLSDGQQLRLSKHYGLVAGPSLDSYLNGRYRRRALALTALAERGLGTPVTGAAMVYDFQPGDQFQYLSTTTSNQLNTLCQQSWEQDSILTRRLNATADTLIYTMQVRQRTQTFGAAGAPFGFCSIATANTLYPVGRRTVRYALADTALTPLTNHYTGPAAYRFSSNARRHASHLVGRFEYELTTRDKCRDQTTTDSTALTYFIDFYNTTRYGTGLGITYQNDLNIAALDTRELTAFRKGSQTWGTLLMPTLLAARPTAPATTTTAFPNPCADRLTAAFTLARSQAVAVTLRDALGRVVYAAPAATLPAGSRQLTLPMTSLPAGLYLLQLTFETDNRSEVLRVVKQ